MLPSPEIVVLFFLPAMVANLMLYLSARVYGPGLVVPLDLGQSLGNKRLIGDGRGLTSLPRALAAGLLCGAVQGRLEDAFFLVVGAQFGMVFNSLLKRARGLKRGESHLPWDHIDYILGASLVYACYGSFSLSMLLGGLVYGGLIHFVLGGLIRGLMEHSE